MKYNVDLQVKFIPQPDSHRLQWEEGLQIILDLLQAANEKDKAEMGGNTDAENPEADGSGEPTSQ